MADICAKSTESAKTGVDSYDVVLIESDAGMYSVLSTMLGTTIENLRVRLGFSNIEWCDFRDSSGLIRASYVKTNVSDARRRDRIVTMRIVQAWQKSSETGRWITLVKHSEILSETEHYHSEEAYEAAATEMRAEILANHLGMDL